MSRISRFTVSCALLCAMSSGCQSVVDYPVDRAKDFIDIVGVDFYWGQGVLANIRATKLVQAGIGKFDGCHASYATRACGVAEEIRAEAGLPLYYFTMYDRTATDMSNENFVERLAAETGYGEVKYNLTDPQDRSYYQVGANAAVFVGLGLNVDIFQVLDFGLGIFGLDIGKDDSRYDDVPDVHGPRFERISDLPVSEGIVRNDS